MKSIFLFSGLIWRVDCSRLIRVAVRQAGGGDGSFEGTLPLREKSQRLLSS